MNVGEEGQYAGPKKDSLDLVVGGARASQNSIKFSQK